MSEDLRNTLLAIGVFLLVAFCVTDCSVGLKRYCPGEITGHLYDPPYVTLESDGKHTRTVYHSAKYYLVVVCSEPEHVAKISVGLTGYALYQDHDRVIVGERIGRWTGFIWSDWIERRDEANVY